MTLLYIYLGSIVFFDTTITLASRALGKEIVNLGYQEQEKPQNIFKTIIKIIKFIGVSAIPVFNLVSSIYLIFNLDEAIKEIIEEGIHDGSYVKIEENLTKEEKQTEASKIITYNVSNELTNEEKIEFLKQELSRLTGQEITIKEKKGRQKRI